MVRTLEVSIKEKQKGNRELIGFSAKYRYVFGKYRIEAKLIACFRVVICFKNVKGFILICTHINPERKCKRNFKLFSA